MAENVILSFTTSFDKPFSPDVDTHQLTYTVTRLEMFHYHNKR